MTYEELLAEVISQHPEAKEIILELQRKNKAPYQIIDTLDDMGILSPELKKEYEKPPSHISMKDEE